MCHPYPKTYSMLNTEKKIYIQKGNNTTDPSYIKCIDLTHDSLGYVWICTKEMLQTKKQTKNEEKSKTEITQQILIHERKQ